MSCLKSVCLKYVCLKSVLSKICPSKKRRGPEIFWGFSSSLSSALTIVLLRLQLYKYMGQYEKYKLHIYQDDTSSV